MTPLGIVAIGMSLAVFFFKRSLASLLVVLVAFSGFTASSAVNLGGNSITPFYLIASVLISYGGIRYVGGSWPFDRSLRYSRKDGWWLLPAFVAWTCVITIVSPILFRGVLVLSPRGGTDAQVSSPTPLGHSISNLAQLLYLFVSVGVFYLIAGQRSSVARLPSYAFGVTAVVSFARYWADMFGVRTAWLFDNSLNVRYINFTSDGTVARFRGIFPEPSSFTSFCIAGFVFFIAQGSCISGRARLISFGLALLCFYNMVQSAAGTSITGGLLVLIFVVTVNLYRIIRRRKVITTWGLLAGLGTLTMIVLASGLIVGYVSRIVEGKVGSESLYVRTTADLFSLDIAARTAFLGVGLGANRPATFWLMLLSCTGLVGVCLFVRFVGISVGAAWRASQYRPAAWALVAFLLCKTAAGPNLAEPVLWVLMGVCAHALWADKSPSTRPPLFTEIRATAKLR